MKKKKIEFYFSAISLAISLITLFTVFSFRYFDNRETIDIYQIRSETNYKKIINTGGGVVNWGTGESYMSKTRTLILSNNSNKKITIKELTGNMKISNDTLKTKVNEILLFNNNDERIYLPLEIDSHSNILVFASFHYDVEKINDIPDFQTLGIYLRMETTKKNTFSKFINFYE